MSSEWQTLPLGDLTTNFDGRRVPVKEADRRRGPYPYYGASGVVDHVDGYLFDGDYLLIAEDGENLRTRQTPVAFMARGRFWVNNHAHIVQGNKRAITRFLHYALAATDISGYLTGSTMPKLTQGNMNCIPVVAPPLLEQTRIAYILGTLDDKIELNRRMNATLEAMSRALFKSWFVDFDPVRSKVAGRQPECMDAETAALFPDSFEESEIGEVPKGWRIRRASDLYDVTIGKTPPRKEHQWFTKSPADVPWMSIKDLGEAGAFVLNVSEYLTAEAVDRFRVRRIPDGTVVLSFKLTVGRVAITDGEMLSNEAIAHFRPLGVESPSAEYLYCYLKQFDYGRLGSTSSIATAVNSESVRLIPLIEPRADVVTAFRERIWPSFSQMRGLQRQCRSLATLRDTLLPKLLSGEVRVPEAEKAVEEAVG
jgi:type I restriction enzyme S subunit